MENRAPDLFRDRDRPANVARVLRSCQRPIRAGASTREPARYRFSYWPAAFADRVSRRNRTSLTHARAGQEAFQRSQGKHYLILHFYSRHTLIESDYVQNGKRRRQTPPE